MLKRQCIQKKYFGDNLKIFNQNSINYKIKCVGQKSQLKKKQDFIIELCIYSHLFYIQSICFKSAHLMIGDYKIFKKQILGEGSFGQVYRGEAKQGGTPVAIKKLIRIKIDPNQYLYQALKQEIHIMQTFNSPNIVSLYDTYSTDNHYYLVQQLCDGDLKTYLEEKTKSQIPISESQAVKMLTQICNGFVAIISQGIIHRDLKPANIMMKNDILKIGDFGMSKRNPSMNHLNQSYVGTPAYMSLQQLKSQRYTSKCDVWALGVIFYEILHGAYRTPFAANSLHKLAQNISTKKLTIQRKDLKKQTIDFIQKCLQIQEKSRMSWDQVLSHKIFCNSFNLKDRKSTFQNMGKQVTNTLKQKIKKEEINVDDLLKTRKIKRPEDILNFEQFYLFLKEIDQQISETNALETFQMIDTKTKKHISRLQLEQWLRIQKGSQIQDKHIDSAQNINLNQENPSEKVSQKQRKIKKKQDDERLQIQNPMLKARISRKSSLIEQNQKQEAFKNQRIASKQLQKQIQAEKEIESQLKLKITVKKVQNQAETHSQKPLTTFSRQNSIQQKKVNKTNQMFSNQIFRQIYFKM